MAGGIVTNSNQSAAYVRLLARNGALGIDGVYYNPAGLTKLDKGFNFSFNNQTIFQTNGVVSNYPFLHHAPDAKYSGEVTAPIFPGIYAAYRFDKFAVSFGFNPVGGGGGAEYDKGLPSFEMDISDLVPSMSSSGLPVTDYSTDIYFKGTSVYFAYQLGLSYEIIPEVSVFAGARYVTVKNTYKGHIRDIMIDYSGQFLRADAFFTGAATQYTDVATFATATANAINDAIQQGEINPNDPLTDPTLIQGLEQLGIDPTGFTNYQAAGAYSLAAQSATESAAAMTANAEATGDKEVDVTQKGTGVTPVIGVNLTLCEKLNIGLRYEFLTKIELKNHTLVDGTGEFPDGEKIRSDMPALLAIGATYPFIPKLRGYLDFNYYFDRGANYGRTDTLGNFISNKDVIGKNYYEISGGLEYNITKKILVSAGYLYSRTGVDQSYQTDLSNSLTSTAFGFGGAWQVSPRVAINIGALFVTYYDSDKTYGHFLGSEYIPVTETYSRSNSAYSIGVDFRLGK